MKFPEPKDMAFPTEVKSDRMVLRQGKMNDKKVAEETLKAIQEAKGDQATFSPFSKTDMLKDILSFYNWQMGKWQKTGFTYMMYEKKTDEFLGYVGLHSFIKYNKTAELDYWLKPSATGHGYCTEAIKKIEKLAFKNGINRLVIKIDALNTKSTNVAQRAGYHLDGILRQDSYVPDLKVINDTLYYSKLKSEWEMQEKEKAPTLHKILKKHCVRKSPCQRTGKGSK